ncbi:MAG: DUF6709 family protein [Erysipelotrichaceae bacterium]
MKKLISKYRLKFKRQIIMILMLMIVFSLPFFILTFSKIRSFVETKEITRMIADLHQEVNQGDSLKNKLFYHFDSNDMSNRSALMNIKKIYGPYDQVGNDKYYIVQLDDAYFMIAKSDGKSLYNSKGGISIANTTQKKNALTYIKDQQLSDLQTLSSNLSNYYYQVDYVGDMPKNQFVFLALSLLGIILFTIYSLYRLFQSSPLLRFVNRSESLTRRDQEIMDYELEGMKKYHGILFGRNYCYVFQGWHHNIIQFVKYEDIVWFYPLLKGQHHSAIVLYDAYGTSYIIRDFDTEEAYKAALDTLPLVAPYASMGWTKEYQAMMKKNFYEFVLLSKQRRSQALTKHKKTLLDSSDEPKGKALD